MRVIAVVDDRGHRVEHRYRDRGTLGFVMVRREGLVETGRSVGDTVPN